MTDAELAELLQDCPTLFHMAACGSWPSIQRRGLLSTSALLDECGVNGHTRELLEASRRPEAVPLSHPAFGQAVLRDQKPMDDGGLSRCLQDGLTPNDWYRLLNRRVFFWLTRDRLYRLLEAQPYREAEHDVLELDTAALVADYRDRITFCAINSGANKPFPAPRGRSTMLPIADYPYATWRAKRPRGERVVELAVAYGVPDIAKFVRRTLRMRGREVVAELYEGEAPQMPVNSQSKA